MLGVGGVKLNDAFILVHGKTEAFTESYEVLYIYVTFGFLHRFISSDMKYKYNK